MKLIDKLYMFVSHLIHGRDRSTIDFDIDLHNADGYFICYHKEKRNGVDTTMRLEHPFYVDNRSLLKNKERLLAARIITDAVKLGYNPQYVLFFHDATVMPTPEQAAMGITASTLFKGVYTQLGQVDPVEFAIEYAKYQKRVDKIADTGIVPKIFDFRNTPTRFSSAVTKRAIDIASTRPGQTPLSLLTERYSVRPHRANDPKPFRTAVPFQPRIAFTQAVDKYKVTERFPQHLMFHAR